MEDTRYVQNYSKSNLKSRGLLAEGPWNVEGAAESKEQQLSSLVRF